MNELSAHARRQRRLFVGMALLFFGPLGMSFLFYYGFGSRWHPAGHVNKGDLIQPPRPLPERALPLQQGGDTGAGFLKGKWTFLYVQQGRCEADCLRHLYDTRQVRLALDRDMGRVQRVFIAAADCCDLAALKAAHPDLISIRADAAAQELLKLLPAASEDAQRIYLIDPLGNAMMFYAPAAPAKGMLEDMKRLLSLSQIG